LTAIFKSEGDYDPEIWTSNSRSSKRQAAIFNLYRSIRIKSFQTQSDCKHKDYYSQSFQATRSLQLSGASH